MLTRCERHIQANLLLFEMMKGGVFSEGEATLRLKMDMSSPNPNMWDQVRFSGMRDLLATRNLKSFLRVLKSAVYRCCTQKPWGYVKGIVHVSPWIKQSTYIFELMGLFLLSRSCFLLNWSKVRLDFFFFRKCTWEGTDYLCKQAAHHLY